MKTTIQVSKKTKDKLKALKLTSRESYDEILNRIVSEVKDGRE